MIVDCILSRLFSALLHNFSLNNLYLFRYLSKSALFSPGYRNVDLETIFCHIYFHINLLTIAKLITSIEIPASTKRRWQESILVSLFSLGKVEPITIFPSQK